MKTDTGTVSVRRSASRSAAPSASRRAPGAAYAVALWSLAYAVLGVHWALGGAGFPFGARHDPWAHLSVLASARPASAGPAITLVGILGGATALSMVRDVRRGRHHRAVLAVAWGFAACLALVIPDVRLLTFTAYAPVLLVGAIAGGSPAATVDDAVWWPTLHQLLVLGGGLLWATAAVAYGRHARGPGGVARAPGRGERWTSPAAATRWGRWAVTVAVLVPVLYAVTRWAWAFGVPLGISDASLRLAAAAHGGSLAAAVGLGSVAIAGAVLTTGLVRPWGEIFPHWLPVVGGRRVPRSAVLGPATLASILVTTAGLTFVRQVLAGALVVSVEDWAVIGPTLLWPVWGVSLGAATLAYYHRTRETQARRP